MKATRSSHVGLFIFSKETSFMKIAFLDRDGVINRYPGHGKYVTKLKEFHFIPGSIEAIAKLTEMGYQIFVVSNQAGVGKGIYSKHKLDKITDHMLKTVKKTGGKIQKVFYCTHRREENCECRKPEIGSIENASKLLKVKMSQFQKSFFIGDTQTDILTGHRAGCQTIFVLSGGETRRSIRHWQVQPDHIAKNLSEAVHIVEHENSNHSRLGRSRSHKSR